jgi:hypothetical protein
MPKTVQNRRLAALPLILLIALGSAAVATLNATAPEARDPNIPFAIAYIEERLLRAELEILSAEQARPLIAGDRSMRILLAGVDGEEHLEAKWKPVAEPGEGQNNEPRYELAAYRFQKLFLDEPEYVVPPAVLRSMPLDAAMVPTARPTLRGTNSRLVLVTFWVQNVTNRDPWDPVRFQGDTRYQRHWANLNILTHLIDHKDGNVGNLLISTVPDSPRVFAVDNDVAFASLDSDQGTPWRRLHVTRLPAQTVLRLRGIKRTDLEAHLAVLAEFEIVDGQLQATEPGPNLNPHRGVRRTSHRVQFGLTSREIRDLEARINRLLSQVDRGRIQTF